jgi:hypothetical protein
VFVSWSLFDLIGNVVSEVVTWRARRGRRIWPIIAGIALVVAAAVLFVAYG